MAYERNTTEGIRAWLKAEVDSPGWHSASIAKGLTEDVMTIVEQIFSELDSKIKQGVLLSALCMRKGDLMLLGDNLNKIIDASLQDKDDFVKTTAHVLKGFPNTQNIDLNIDIWSTDFRKVLQSIGSNIESTGINFHAPEEMILQNNAWTTPAHASPTYNDRKSTHVQHYTLTSNTDDIVSTSARHARFKELVDMEERSEQAEAQAAQVVAQKRAGAELSSKAKRVASPTSNVPNPFPFPPHRGSVPISPGGPAGARSGAIPPRSFSLGSVPAPVSGSSSLFTKRPARPTAPGGGLFIKQNKPSAGARSMARSSTVGHVSNANVPRGLQRVQKTQMLDFSAATEIEQNAANAIKKAQDDIKAKAEAKKQELLEKKKRAAEEKREREEAKKAQRAAALAAKQAAQAAKEAAAREAREAKEVAAAAAQEAEANEDNLPRSPTSAPTSPKTPTSTLSPQIKHEHVFNIPSMSSHHAQQQQQQPLSEGVKSPGSNKLTTF